MSSEEIMSVEYIVLCLLIGIGGLSWILSWHQVRAQRIRGLALPLVLSCTGLIICALGTTLAVYRIPTYIFVDKAGIMLTVAGFFWFCWILTLRLIHLFECLALKYIGKPLVRWFLTGIVQPLKFLMQILCRRTQRQSEDLVKSLNTKRRVGMFFVLVGLVLLCLMSFIDAQPKSTLGCIALLDYWLPRVAVWGTIGGGIYLLYSRFTNGNELSKKPPLPKKPT